MSDSNQVIAFEDREKWYDGNIGLYESLAKSIAQTLRDLLEANNVDFVEIKNRSKTKESFLEKIERKKYIDFEKEMTDLAGIRVIVLLESNIAKVSNLVSTAFSVHPDDSVDKSTDLGLDRVGYRSVHFVCDVGYAREGLPEFARFKDKCFEVQVRTVLQNTWADIAHSKSYKLKGVIPDKLNRRLNLISGTLELIDLELSSLSEEIEVFNANASYKININEFEDIEITSQTVLDYLKKIGFDLNLRGSIPVVVLEELGLFGVKTIADLDQLVNDNGDEFLKYTQTLPNEFRVVGFLRDAMIYSDIDRYFKDSWRYAWFGMSDDDEFFNLLVSKYGESKVHEIINSFVNSEK